VFTAVLDQVDLSGCLGSLMVESRDFVGRPITIMQGDAGTQCGR
jgi:hypothetical protein